MEGIKCILLDIEGTICPISFVKDTLFPYALKALPNVLVEKWDEEEFKEYREAFPETARESRETLQAHVEDLTKRDVKAAPLKNLQGYLWENGYKTGAYSTPLFPDVTPQLKQWKKDGFQLAIYSSGSVFAQKLLFGHINAEPEVASQKRKRPNGTENDGDHGVGGPPPKKRTMAAGGVLANQQTVGNLAALGSSETAQHPDTSVKEDDSTSNDARVSNGADTTEDLQHLITDWFDTTNAGLKTEAASYEKIADLLKWSPGSILFLSDNVKEVVAAARTGMRSIMVDRPGNAPLSDEDRDRLHVVTSLDEIKLARNRVGGKNDKSRSGKPVERRSQRLKTKGSNHK